MTALPTFINPPHPQGEPLVADTIAEALTDVGLAPSTHPPGYTTAALAGMHDDEFRDLVSNHLGPDEPTELWDALLAEDVLPRTRAVLDDTLGRLNDQIARRRIDLDAFRLDCLQNEGGQAAFLEAKVEFRDWERRAKGFRRLVNARMQQARQRERALKAAKHARHQAANVNESRSVAARLTVGLVRHRQAVLAAGMQPEPHDRALWALLDELTVEAGGERVTLAQAVEFGFWTVREGE